MKGQRRAYTVQQVRESLPDVPVTWHGSVVVAKLSGRKNAFATVTYLSLPISYEFTWEGVTRAINTGKPLLFE